MKRLLSAVMCIAIVLLLSSCETNRTIGTIHGAEWDFIEIDGVEYTKVTSSGIHWSDKGRYLGIVSNGGKIEFKCYSVKNDNAGRYIYCLWEWEGSIYERIFE